MRATCKIEYQICMKFCQKNRKAPTSFGLEPVMKPLVAMLILITVGAISFEVSAVADEKFQKLLVVKSANSSLGCS